MFSSLRRQSQLLRLAVGVLAALLALAAIGMIVDGSSLVGNITWRGSSLRLTRLVLLGVVNLLLMSVLAMFAALYLWARMSRSLPELQAWHLQNPESEFQASDAESCLSLDDYCSRENHIFEELDAIIRHSWSNQGDSKYSRYNPNSVCFPENVDDVNWNRTHVIDASEPVGGVVLLHGLSDSPYSLRAFGEGLRREGYSVVWVRLPGHGTTPRALAEVSWQDWTAAVKIAVRGMRQRLPEGVPLVLAGYSNGGALSVHYALEASDDNDLPRVDALVLFSPMIGINPLARVTWLYHLAGLISQSEKSKWSNIYAEVDPFKYSSWPMNANVQAWTMTRAVERRLAALEKAGRMAEFPPVFAAQSVVDSTVSVTKLITALFDRLMPANNELLLFDVNRVDGLSNLVNLSFDKSVAPQLERDDGSFRLSLLANRDSTSDQVSLKIREHGRWTERGMDLRWPANIVSLSHIAVPIPPSDSVYGKGMPDDPLRLGTAQMRAEPSALMVPSSIFTRSRHNPFYDFMEQRAIQWLAENLEVTGKSRDWQPDCSAR